MLGLALFDRGNRRVSLTASGEQLVRYARRILALNDEAVGRLTEDLYEGELRLGVPHDIVYPVVPRVLKHVQRRLSARQCQSALLEHGEAARGILQRGEVDLILTTEAGVDEGGETLTEMALRWTGAPGGTSWKRRPLRLAFCTNCIFRPIVLRKLEQAGSTGKWPCSPRMIARSRRWSAPIWPWVRCSRTAFPRIRRRSSRAARCPISGCRRSISTPGQGGDALRAR